MTSCAGGAMLSSRIFRRCRGALLAAVLLLCSCSVYEDDERYFEGVVDFFIINGYLLWMLVTKPPEITVEDMRGMFAEHRGVMEDIVQTCEEHPRINRIYAEDGEEDYYGEGEVGPELAVAIESVRVQMREISASLVTCSRWHNVENKPLGVVSFVVYAAGLSVSGVLRKISYRTEWSQNHSQLSKEMLEERGYHNLPEAGWYIYDSEAVVYDGIYE